MRLLSVSRVSQSRTRSSFLTIRAQTSRTFSQLHSNPERSSFGIAFDIDGVILRGRTPIGGSPQALKRLYSECGTMKIPFLFLTNGGGVPESKRAIELSELLDVNILPLQHLSFMSLMQVVQGHYPFKTLVAGYENKLIVAIGKGEPAEVMSDYGFKKVLSMDEYASYFDNIDPLAQYKIWEAKTTFREDRSLLPRYDVLSERVQAAFIVSDPVDWSRDIQVLCDILTSGGLPGQANRHQPPLYFAADDLEYQAAFPSMRLGMGAFRIALEAIFSEIHPLPLEYTSYGKPNSFVFKNAEAILKQLQQLSCDEHDVLHNGDAVNHSFRTLYMIGDNPSVDIKGAQQARSPWLSILTRTGVFRGEINDPEFPADLVVDDVEEAVDYIFRRESTLGNQ
ncbi:hypothetical protein GIB67_030330 [Kingdonia uniflora]|uniref:Uncharacterized protein n=1 Tax=Kingdonia uniflora TaxID=39325 RepID=A0A7J7M6M3_9MAGN|nr:hypothetical protein GIB67_030330 [Kingdonia uniflora]